MRFILMLWSLILLPLVLFTLALFSQEIFGLSLPPIALRVVLLIGAWTIGLASAAAIHVLYRRSEQAVRQAARDQTIVQLAGAVAHELNQPLTVLISSGELLAHPGRSPDEMRQVALRMVDASHRMSNIVEKLQKATHYRTKEYVSGIKIVDLDRTG